MEPSKSRTIRKAVRRPTVPQSSLPDVDPTTGQVNSTSLGVILIGPSLDLFVHLEVRGRLTTPVFSLRLPRCFLSRGTFLLFFVQRNFSRKPWAGPIFTLIARALSARKYRVSLARSNNRASTNFFNGGGELLRQFHVN